MRETKERTRTTMRVNGAPEVDVTDALARAQATNQLESLVSRILRLENEKRETTASIKEIYEEAKGKGFSVKAMRIVVKRALESADQRSERVLAEQEAELMEAQLGQLFDTPLGQAAMADRAEAH